MVFMGIAVRLLPVRWIVAVGTAIILVHNLFDGLNAAALGKFADLWLMLHGMGSIWIVPGKIRFYAVFSLVPWVGVMAVGYGLGALLLQDNWRKPVSRIGAALTIAFLALRAFHLYGNGQPSLQPWAPDAAGPWTIQSTPTLTICSFFDTLKYPASLQFLLMTLGPSLMALAWLDTVNVRRSLGRVLLVFGRVPLFFYILHLYFIHSLAVWVGFGLHQPVAWLVYGGPMLHLPPLGYGHGLPFIYAMWLLVLAMLHVPCKWFMQFKQQHRNWAWLRYL
jgi:uncharacterized membrane protein